MPCEAFQPPSGGPRGSDRQMQQCHPRTDLEARASTLGCKRVAVGIPWQGGSRMRAAVDPGLAPRRRGCNGADHRGEPCGGPNRSASPPPTTLPTSTAASRLESPCRQPPQAPAAARVIPARSEEHTSELQSRVDLVCRLLLEKKKKNKKIQLNVKKKKKKKQTNHCDNKH